MHNFDHITKNLGARYVAVFDGVIDKKIAHPMISVERPAAKGIGCALS